ncbi:hypothetical protein CWATWH0003_0569 [Crocosphaera watsonii WH 0003]|uniref:Uncharacterized protein n=1 Tax=Crocosphaera watsonii WH 0003 TaxID=423471 RepID=G5IZ74_CROWT|nr:hypothetical protein CWATWH0003_0569 [Crocosphaera watsonii WH 0003]
MPLDLSLIGKGLTPLLKPTVSWTHDKIIGREILGKRELKKQHYNQFYKKLQKKF